MEFGLPAGSLPPPLLGVIQMMMMRKTTTEEEFKEIVKACFHSHAEANVPPINEVVNKCNSFLTCVFFEIKRYGSDNRAGQFYAFINTAKDEISALGLGLEQAERLLLNATIECIIDNPTAPGMCTEKDILLLKHKNSHLKSLQTKQVQAMIQKFVQQDFLNVEFVDEGHWYVLSERLAFELQHQLMASHGACDICRQLCIRSVAYDGKRAHAHCLKRMREVQHRSTGRGSSYAPQTANQSSAVTDGHVHTHTHTHTHTHAPSPSPAPSAASSHTKRRSQVVSSDEDENSSDEIAPTIRKRRIRRKV